MFAANKNETSDSLITCEIIILVFLQVKQTGD